jgi:hypothetical protein
LFLSGGIHGSVHLRRFFLEYAFPALYIGEFGGIPRYIEEKKKKLDTRGTGPFYYSDGLLREIP